MLKEIKATEKLNIKNFSSLCLRKTFGRQVFSMSGENYERHLLNSWRFSIIPIWELLNGYLDFNYEEIREACEFLRF